MAADRLQQQQISTHAETTLSLRQEELVNDPVAVMLAQGPPKPAVIIVGAEYLTGAEPEAESACMGADLIIKKPNTLDHQSIENGGQDLHEQHEEIQALVDAGITPAETTCHHLKASPCSGGAGSASRPIARKRRCMRKQAYLEHWNKVISLTEVLRYLNDDTPIFPNCRARKTILI